MEESSSDNWNVVCERIHFRHDGHWTLRFREELQDREQLLCVACVIEMVEENAISVVRKKYALACFRNVLVRFPCTVVELLSVDARVCIHFIVTLLDMLRNVEDNVTLDLVIEVLVLLTAELKSEQFVCCVLDECQKQLSEKNSMRRSLPIFTLLGKLLLAIPFLAEKLIQEYVMLLEHMRVALVYPDEAVKASVCYIFCILYSNPPAAEKLSMHFSERLCNLFVSIMEAAQTKELQVNSLGLLKHLLQFRQFVTVMMSSLGTEEPASEDEVTSQGGNSLLLLLKKLLLSRDETLQIASVQCMTSILVHSPVQYAPALLYADISEFLFERLSSTDEILVWSLYSCLLLLTEEKLFFSKCHTIYGIESLVRSLKETMRVNNIEVQKQGLLLFGEILKRQPTGIKLFMNFTIWHEAIVVLQEAMTSSSLEVMIEAANAVAAFLRKDHLAVPVKYKELQSLIEAMLMRCADLPVPSMIRSNANTKMNKESQNVRREQNKKFSRQGQLLFSALKAFLNACRLAVDCQKDPSVQENAFTAPSTASEDMLERYSEFLLKVCDTLCIPIVMKHYEKTPSATVMEVFFSILNVQYSILPNTANLFTIKLASSSFIRFTLELKAKFCTGGRNPKLNQACSDFLCSMCRILFSATENALNYQNNFDDISALFAKCIPHLNYTFLGAIAVLSESSDTIGIDEDLQDSHHCLLVILYLAHMYENRFFSEGPLFTAISSFLHTSLDRGHSPPPFVVRAALYLLSVCQEKCSSLDWAPLSSICKLLEGIPNFSSVYTCHPLVLKFFFHYPELTDRFGHCVLKCWFAHVDISCFEDENLVPNSQTDKSCMMNITQGNPNVLLILLDMVHTGEIELAFKALLTLKLFLRNNDSMLPTSDLLRPRLLQILQRFTIENNAQPSKGNKNLPLVLDLLSLVQIKIGDLEEMGSTDFKLLYHVSNLAGKCKTLSTEILQPAFNFFYCSLKQTSTYNRNRVVSMLLSNSCLMELLEKILELSWSEQSALEPLPDALVCSVWLLIGSLVQNQTNCKSEVSNTESMGSILGSGFLRVRTQLTEDKDPMRCEYLRWWMACSDMTVHPQRPAGPLKNRPLPSRQLLKALYRMPLLLSTACTKASSASAENLGARTLAGLILLPVPPDDCGQDEVGAAELGVLDQVKGPARQQDESVLESVQSLSDLPYTAVHCKLRELQQQPERNKSCVKGSRLKPTGSFFNYADWGPMMPLGPDSNYNSGLSGEAATSFLPTGDSQKRIQDQKRPFKSWTLQEVCRKYVQLLLLANRISELELGVDSLWSICDAEIIVDRTFSEVVTPQVHRTVGVNLSKVLHCVSFRKDSSLLQVCILQFLQTVLRHNFISPLLAVTVSYTRNRPLQDKDAVLYPLSSQQVLLLFSHLQNFLVQGDDFLVCAATSCLEALMEYLHSRDQATVCHVVSQPWSRFLLFTLVNSAENCLLNSGLLRLFVLVKAGGKGWIHENVGVGLPPGSIPGGKWEPSSGRQEYPGGTAVGRLDKFYCYMDNMGIFVTASCLFSHLPYKMEGVAEIPRDAIALVTAGSCLPMLSSADPAGVCRISERAPNLHEVDRHKCQYGHISSTLLPIRLKIAFSLGTQTFLDLDPTGGAHTHPSGGRNASTHSVYWPPHILQVLTEPVEQEFLA
ncbi:meiosis inhibitor protein 1-like [Heptranchias perlo]|uniref:meiosis inhibitor protein 1-like n=1 Tax=Heptranchias perlo TaxID=212740 RepID=UPI00355AC0F7